MSSGKKGRGWNMIAGPYTQSKQIVVEANCFSFMFTNLGDTPATVNDMIIFPSATPTTALGDSRSIGAHVMDLYEGRLTLKFVAPIGGNPKVEIVQLFYTSETELKNE